MGLFSFPHSEKLKSRKIIGEVFNEGTHMKAYPLKLVYLKTPLSTTVPIQTAVTVSKRNIKKAHQRNRIKRLIREAYRLNKHLVTAKVSEPHAFVFLYLAKEELDYSLIHRKMEQLLTKFEEKN